MKASSHLIQDNALKAKEDELRDELWEAHLSSELPESGHDRQTVPEQDVVEVARTESLQVHLLLVVPEFI